MVTIVDEGGDGGDFGRDDQPWFGICCGCNPSLVSMAMAMMWLTQNWTSPKGGHGDDGVPEGGWDRLKSASLHILKERHLRILIKARDDIWWCDILGQLWLQKIMMIWWLIWWRWRWDSDLFTIEHDGGEDDDVVNGGDDGDLFTIEHDGGEDDDGHGERENKEAELGRAGLEDCFRTSYFLYVSLYTCSV